MLHCWVRLLLRPSSWARPPLYPAIGMVGDVLETVLWGWLGSLSRLPGWLELRALPCDRSGSLAGLPAWAGCVWQSGKAVGWASLLGGSRGCASRLPRTTVQVPWLCEARDYAHHLGMDAALVPCLSRAIGRVPQLPRFSGQASHMQD